MRKLADEPAVFLPSVRVPSQLDADLRETAQRQGVTPSVVIRQALTWYLSATKPNPQVKEAQP